MNPETSDTTGPPRAPTPSPPEPYERPQIAWEEEFSPIAASPIDPCTVDPSGPGC